MKRYLVLPLLMILCRNVFSADLSQAKVTFKASTNMGSTVMGEATGIQGEIKGEIGEAAFELSKLDTGMGLRNTHMLEDLHAKAHPVAVLKWHGPVADLTLNGVTKTIALIHDGKVYSFDVELPNFKLQGRRYLGVGVGDTVSVSVEIP